MIFISILIIIVAIALPSLRKQLSPILLLRISSIIMIYAGALSLNAFYIQTIGSGIGIYSGLFNVTSLSQQLDIFLLFIGALILIPRPGIYEKITSSQNNNIINNTSIHLAPEASMPNTEIGSGIGGKYSLIILFTSLGSILLMSSSDLLSMYLSIELQSFGLYILSTLFRDSKLATNAGLKYFLLGGFSSCIILLGAAIVYTYSGLTNLESIFSLISVSSISNNSMISINQGITLGFILIIIGFLFKVSAAPLHNWAPDVYDDSPTIVTIWLTIIPKIAILVFLLELIIGGLGYSQSNIINNLSIEESLLIKPYEIIKNLLLLTSLFSLIIGSVVGLAQNKIKRLLAYSTISHIGFILLALSINTEQSIESFIFYIIQYSVTNLDIFLIILAFGYLINGNKPGLDMDSEIENKDIRFISELKGQFMANPLLSISLSVCLFSLAGIPPLMGFFSKQMVLYSALQQGYYFISIIAILMSVISASYYLKIVRILFSENTSSNKNYNSLLSNNSQIEGQYFITNSHSILISILTLAILLFIFKPSLLLNSTQLLSLTLYHC
jgi:NADH-ubiquinone oxidoreductase chain 2